ncbi:hypothetical protein KC19_VG335000 [Ceratodon purpureus]|uniref:Uncharacterized protein n=1 Tax=Ceratodon purpureus TaxID=3225 RepID=A0A8T0HXB4_CERPU|nr:hypothetical protein KC19_VG335000 [Ceratodon purpureus]
MEVRAERSGNGDRGVAEQGICDMGIPRAGDGGDGGEGGGVGLGGRRGDGDQRWGSVSVGAEGGEMLGASVLFVAV